MATTAKVARYKKQIKAYEEDKKRAPEERKLQPRDLIRVRRRCRLCGRSRAVYRKFGICRICFRNMAHEGVIPGVTKASW